MKKLIAGLILGGLLVMPVLGLAQEDTILEEECTLDLSFPENIKGKDEECTPGEQVDDPICCMLNLIFSVGNWIYGIVMVLAIIVILIAAFTFLTAGGDPTKITKAKNYLVYALVGIVLAILARGIINLVIDLLSTS